MAIKTCSCKHEYQDLKYGKQKRIHNPSSDKTKLKCTVCNTVIRVTK